MTPDSTIFSLAQSGNFRDAAFAIDEQSGRPLPIRVLRCQLEAHVGSPLRARDLAERLLRERLTNSDRAFCWDIIGRVNLSVGQTDSGLRGMHRAAQFASDSGDARLQARLMCSLAEGLLHWVGIEPAALEVSRLRRVVIRSADPHSMVALHSLCAEIQAKRGQMVAASRSVQTAKSLLGGFGNLWQQGRLAITSSGIAIINADYPAALTFTEEALWCAEKSGSRELRIPALGNFAHIKLACEAAKDADGALNELLGVVRKGGSTEIGVRDTQMQLALASGDLDLAGSLAEEIHSISETLEDGHSYYGLWHLLTRVRWLYRTDQADAGLALAMDAIPRIKRMADRNLLERMKLLAAEGLGRVGRAVDGARLMADAVSANPDPPLEMIAEASRVAGRLAAHDDAAAAASHFGRAARILYGVGNLTAHAEVQRDAAESAERVAVLSAVVTGGEDTGPPRFHEDPPARDLPDLRPPAASLTERIAALIDLAAHPPLLAAEILSLVADTHAALHARIVEIGPAGQREVQAAIAAADAPAWRDDHPDCISLTLGPHRDREFTIVALPRPTATARATLLAVERLAHTALALARARHQEREQTALWPEPSPEQQLGLVCASERMLELITSVRRVAPSNITVLITGETGVGKELFARALHQASARHDRIFLPFNCTAVPRDIIDSQLFGYRRGAFTGAHDDSPGLIRSAAGGTLFLDEIGEMSTEAQPKLLRFLESGEILPLGEPRPQFVDVRIVAATNANLEQLVADGKFREDLYYRLNVIPLHVPPLRERREEIPLLVDHFLDKFSDELQKPLLRVAEETLEYLVLYRWPGNVRQLANELRRMVALAEPGAILMPEHLSPVIAASRRTVPADRRTLEPTEMVIRVDQPMAAATEHLERALIQRALKTSDGKMDDAAKLLGLSRKGLYLKRQRLGLE